MEPIDLVVAVTGWVVGNIVFKNFAKHLTLSYGVLFAMGGGILVLHFWWLPKHGINGLTAEPYDRYLKLIGKVKGK
ncbi:MAG: hypothetical protein HY660_05900 [Armatimonadetes bacterium]|nr:hypothetical protein [Armatimonadota bacterium]